jgi:hypothetical protein
MRFEPPWTKDLINQSHSGYQLAGNNKDKQRSHGQGLDCPSIVFGSDALQVKISNGLTGSYWLRSSGPPCNSHKKPEFEICHCGIYIGLFDPPLNQSHRKLSFHIFRGAIG